MSRGTFARMAWHYTIADYVRLEERSNVKHEYIRGEIRVMGAGAEDDREIREMGGGTIEYARIGIAVAYLLTDQLRGRPCAVYSSDARVRVVASDLITYPDLVVCCGSVQQDVDDRCAIINPRVVVEVTSPSSESYNRSGKLDHYKLAPSILDVVIVSHRDRSIEVHHRTEEGEWTIERGGPGESVHVSSIGCVLDVDAVYHDPLAAS